MVAIFIWVNCKPKYSSRNCHIWMVKIQALKTYLSCHLSCGTNIPDPPLSYTVCMCDGSASGRKAHTQQTQFLRYKDHITQERWETPSTSDQNKNPYLYDGNLTQELSLFMQVGEAMTSTIKDSLSQQHPVSFRFHIWQKHKVWQLAHMQGTENDNPRFGAIYKSTVYSCLSY